MIYVYAITEQVPCEQRGGSAPDDWPSDFVTPLRAPV